MKKEVRGVIFTLAGGCLWGLSGSCGQYLFTNYQVNSSWLTVVRMLVAGVSLVLFALLRQRDKAIGIWKVKEDAVQQVVFALGGLMFCQYAYLTAISYSNAATATVLQYLGPVLIMLLVCAVHRRLPNLREGVAVILAVLGTFLLATHGNIATMVLSKQGFTWGMLAAVRLMCYTLLPDRIIPKWGSIVVTGYGMLIGGIVLALLVQVWKIPVSLDLKGWLAVGGVAVLGTLVAYTMYLQGVADVGPVHASMLSSIEPVSATLCSVFWLHTSFQPIDLVGFLCVLATIFLLAKKTEEPKCAAKQAVPDK